MKRWYFSIERIVQKYDHACAVACTATIAGVTFSRALHEFFPERRTFTDDNSLNVNVHDMKRVFKVLGYSSMIVDEYINHRLPAILPFMWHPGEGWGGIHAVVWDPFDKKVIDPGYDHDFGHRHEHYRDLWKRSNFAALVVKGKLKR